MIDLLTPLVNYIILRQARQDAKAWELRLQKEAQEAPERLRQEARAAAEASAQRKIADTTAYYEGLARERARLVPSGCVRDRYGFLYQKNPNGVGRRAVGSDPGEPYWVERDK